MESKGQAKAKGHTKCHLCSTLFNAALCRCMHGERFACPSRSTRSCPVPDLAPLCHRPPSSSRAQSRDLLCALLSPQTSTELQHRISKGTNAPAANIESKGQAKAKGHTKGNLCSRFFPLPCVVVCMANVSSVASDPPPIMQGIRMLSPILPRLRAKQLRLSRDLLTDYIHTRRNLWSCPMR